MEQVRWKALSNDLEIAKANLRHNTFWHIAVAVILLLIAPVLFGIRNLNAAAAAIPLEMFVSLIGIILLTPVFLPEQNPEIEDLVSAKYVSPIKIYVIRTSYSILIIFILIGIFSAGMLARDCSVTLPMLFGTMENALFLGSLGMVSASLSNNTAIGYMIPVLYFAANLGIGNKLGNLYLFSMTLGKYQPKIWLTAAGIILIILSIFYKKVQRQRI